MTDFTPKELGALAHLLRNTERSGSNGNWLNYFSEKVAGRSLTRKLLSANWAHQSGWYLSGRPCFQLTAKGIQGAKALDRESRTVTKGER